MHPAVAKASLVGNIAGDNGWKANLKSETVDSQRVTTLVGTRNDESFMMQWHGAKLFAAEYLIFDRVEKITHSKEMIEKLSGWPDLIKLYKWFPNMNRPLLTEKYRKLPFSLDDPNEEIIAKLLGNKIFWYGHETAKLHVDVVLPKQKDKSRIQDIGHRKLFHFIGAQAGFRSVMLDTLIKVG